MTLTHFAMIVCSLLALVGLALWADEWRQRRRDRRAFRTANVPGWAMRDMKERQSWE